MRLIDADELKEELEKIVEVNEDRVFLYFSGVASLIDKQRTAYDVDKVVEQILNITINLFCDGNRNGGKTLYATTLEEYRRMITNIVKEGGMK